jgi:hypothetical protein
MNTTSPLSRFKLLTTLATQNYYAPQIFAGLGMTGTSVQLFATGVYGIVKTVGCFIFLVFVVDSLGRRRSLLWTSAAQAISMYIVGAYGKVEPPVPGAPVRLFPPRFPQSNWGSGMVANQICFRFLASGTLPLS